MPWDFVMGAVLNEYMMIPEAFGRELEHAVDGCEPHQVHVGRR